MRDVKEEIDQDIKPQLQEIKSNQIRSSQDTRDVKEEIDRIKSKLSEKDNIQTNIDDIQKKQREVESGNISYLSYIYESIFII